MAPARRQGASAACVMQGSGGTQSPNGSSTALFTVLIHITDEAVFAQALPNHLATRTARAPGGTNGPALLTARELPWAPGTPAPCRAVGTSPPRRSHQRATVHWLHHVSVCNTRVSDGAKPLPPTPRPGRCVAAQAAQALSRRCLQMSPRRPRQRAAPRPRLRRRRRRRPAAQAWGPAARTALTASPAFSWRHPRSVRSTTWVSCRR